MIFRLVQEFFRVSKITMFWRNSNVIKSIKFSLTENINDSFLFDFLTANLLWSWNVFNELFRFGRWSSRVLMREWESVLSLSLGEKSLSRCTWKRWKLAVLKFQQPSGFSFRAWGAVLSSKMFTSEVFFELNTEFQSMFLRKFCIFRWDLSFAV